MPLRCVIDTPLRGIPCIMVYCRGMTYNPAWGFCVARFDRQGMRRPQNVERATVQGFTLFYVL